MRTTTGQVACPVTISIQCLRTRASSSLDWSVSHECPPHISQRMAVSIMIASLPTKSQRETPRSVAITASKNVNQFSPMRRRSVANRELTLSLVSSPGTTAHSSVTQRIYAMSCCVKANSRSEKSLYAKSTGEIKRYRSRGLSRCRIKTSHQTQRHHYTSLA